MALKAAKKEKAQQKQKRKTEKKLKRLTKKGKLAKHVRDAYQKIRDQRGADRRKRNFDIEEDWVAYRAEHAAQRDDEGSVPLDMLNADIDWERTKHAGWKRRKTNEEEVDTKDVEFESVPRSFGNGPAADEVELMPTKTADGRVVRQTRKKTEDEIKKEVDDVLPEEDVKTAANGAVRGANDSSDDDDDDDDDDDAGDGERTRVKSEEEEDFSSLSAAELLQKRRQMLVDEKVRIGQIATQLLSDPHEHIGRLRELYRLSTGDDVHSLIREDVQRLAIASTVQAFLDIIPGYHIRLWTDKEKGQQLKKETRKLIAFEEALLRYHLKFLQALEKNAKKLLNRELPSSDSFAYKLAVLSVRSMGRLLIGAPHFNNAENICQAITRLSLSKDHQVTTECCDLLKALFADDHIFRVSHFAARSIANLVNRKAGYVPPELVATFLHLNIKEINQPNEKKKKVERDRLHARKQQIKKERRSKGAKKYDKQLKKLEHDLVELEAEERVDSKQKEATATMRHVFATYFRVLKRLPTTRLLSPVLEGLAKFAHLLNIEFFDDIFLCVRDLVDKQHLSTMDQLQCVSTIFTMLSGEGSVFNIDPIRLYDTTYRILDRVHLERDQELQQKQVDSLLSTLRVMLIVRRRQIPAQRVESFARRLAEVMRKLPVESAHRMDEFIGHLHSAHPFLEGASDDDDSS